MGKITRKQFFVTTSVSVLISTGIYLICGIIGYFLYRDTLKDSILDTLDEGFFNKLLSLANCVNVVMTFPITFAALKNYTILIFRIILTGIKRLFKCVFCCCSNKGRITAATQTKKHLFMTGQKLVGIPKIIEIFLVFMLFVSIFFFAFSYDQLKVIISFTGGVMGNLLSFIFPSVFYLFCSDKKICSKLGAVSVIIIIFGMFTLGVCVLSTAQNLIANK